MKKLLLSFLFLYSSLVFAGLNNVPGPVFGNSGATPIAGQIGFTISNTVTAQALSPATPTNANTLNLTPGLWAISSYIQIISGINTINVGGWQCSISTVSVTQGAMFSSFGGAILAAGAAPTCVPPVTFIRVTSNTTVYAVINVALSAAATTTSGMTAMLIG